MALYIPRWAVSPLFPPGAHRREATGQQRALQTEERVWGLWAAGVWGLAAEEFTWSSVASSQTG